MDILSPETQEYLERHPRVYFAACREIVDLFNWHVFGHKPTRMHIEMQRYMDAPGSVKRVFIPRNHAKTTQLSIGRVAWLIGRNHNLRVQVIQNNRPDASKTVKAIKGLLESDKFKQVFPDLEHDTEEWGKLALTVKRTMVGLRDPTVSAQPIFGAAGSRADLMIFDDIENLDNSIRQPALREGVKDAYRNTWTPVLEPSGQEWDIGTPWHIDGITMDWMRDSQAGGAPMFFRRCEGTTLSPWPEKFSAETLATLRQKQGEIAYSRAYELRALSGTETVFKESDLLASARPLPDWDMLRSPVRWGAIDLAFSEADQNLKRKNRDSVDADWSVMGVADIDASGHVWAVENYRRKCSYPDFKLRAMAMAQRLGVSRVKIECNGPQKGLAQDMMAMFGSVGVSCYAQTRKNKDKFSRASAVQTVVEQGRLHLRTMSGGEMMPDMRNVLEELSQFPLGAKDDAVDVWCDLMAEAKEGRASPVAARGLDYTHVADIEASLDDHEAAMAATGPEQYERSHGDFWMDRD